MPSPAPNQPPSCPGDQILDKNGKCKCPIIGQILISGRCDCGPGKEVINREGISFCGKKCDPSENKVPDGTGGCKCAPGFTPENDRFDAKCIPVVTPQVVTPQVVTPPVVTPVVTPPVVTPVVTPVGAPTKEKNKLIATLFRALPFSGKMLGEFLANALGVPEARKVKNDPKFKYFKDFNMQNWSIAFKSDPKLDGKLKDVESDPPVKDSEPTLSNYILASYRKSSLGSQDNKFVKVFFDLMCAVSSIYKQELSMVYSLYFKEFIKGDVLKLFSSRSGKEDVHTYILNKLVAYNGMSDKDKLTRELYGGRRKTIKRRNPTNKKTKKNKRK